MGSTPARTDLVAFARAYLDAIHAAELAFSEVARATFGKRAARSWNHKQMIWLTLISTVKWNRGTATQRIQNPSQSTRHW